MESNTYEILNDAGEVINVIIATQAFVEANYPGHYRLVPPPQPDYTAINQQAAAQLLSQTDWTSIPAVADPLRSNPYLTNQAEFDAYRSEVRVIAITPPSTPWTPPVQPTAVWSS